MSLVGAHLGRYELLELLGEGGMGRVYLGLDAVLGRRVAVKVLRDDLGLPADARAHLTERLRVEARAVAAIAHPNVVVLHDMGDDPVAGLFLVFELVAGETLRARLARGPLALDDVARLARELGDALDAAHAAGVLHRDVKPENILLGPNGSKIGDFGLARLPEGGLTRSGAILGTPAYAAPETLRGDAARPESDVFAMAATLYEALTAKRAFPGEDLLAVAAAIGGHTPAPIARGELEPHAARELTRVVVERGLAKAPAERFSSAGALGRAITQALRTPPRTSEKRPDERPTRISGGPNGRPPRWLNYLVGLGLLAGLLGIVVERRQHLVPSDDSGAPVAPRAKAPARGGSPSRRPPDANPNPNPSANANANANANPNPNPSANPTPSANDAGPAGLPDGG